MGLKIEITKQCIEVMLQLTNFERAKTARRLGISPPTLTRLIAQHGIVLEPSPKHHAKPKEYYQQMVETTGGGVMEMAKALGVNQNTVRKHMRRHKLGEYSDVSKQP
jgi:DNA-binding NtrC family response regulator